MNWSRRLQTSCAYYVDELWCKMYGAYIFGTLMSSSSYSQFHKILQSLTSKKTGTVSCYNAIFVLYEYFEYEKVTYTSFQVGQFTMESNLMTEAVAVLTRKGSTDYTFYVFTTILLMMPQAIKEEECIVWSSVITSLQHVFIQRPYLFVTRHRYVVLYTTFSLHSCSLKTVSIRALDLTTRKAIN